MSTPWSHHGDILFWKRFLQLTYTIFFHSRKLPRIENPDQAGAESNPRHRVRQHAQHDLLLPRLQLFLHRTEERAPHRIRPTRRRRRRQRQWRRRRRRRSRCRCRCRCRQRKCQDKCHERFVLFVLAIPFSRTCRAQGANKCLVFDQLDKSNFFLLNCTLVIKINLVINTFVSLFYLVKRFFIMPLKY